MSGNRFTEDELFLLFRESPITWLLLDSDSLRIQDASGSMSRFGYSRLDLIGMKVTEICSGVLAIDEDLGYPQVPNGESRFSSWILKAFDGQPVEMLAAYRTLPLSTGERSTIVFLIEEYLRRRLKANNGAGLDRDEWS